MQVSIYVFLCRVSLDNRGAKCGVLLWGQACQRTQGVQHQTSFFSSVCLCLCVCLLVYLSFLCHLNKKNSLNTYGIIPIYSTTLLKTENYFPYSKVKQICRQKKGKSNLQTILLAWTPPPKKVKNWPVLSLLRKQMQLLINNPLHREIIYALYMI